jgi:hypothetical protein
MRSTFFPCLARPEARLIEVVVFATPPFWLIIAMMLFMVDI